MLVQTLLVDGRDQLWIGTYKGLSRYGNGQFSAISAHDDSLVNVYQLAETPEGEIVAATASGLMRVELDRLVSMGERAGPPGSGNQYSGQPVAGREHAARVLVRQQRAVAPGTAVRAERRGLGDRVCTSRSALVGRHRRWSVLARSGGLGSVHR